ncbi:MAG TPA: hypothetical protein VLQ45_00150 [Thermoanaerobaculia bacterium]|nr:hypothetical protein [Thermoanaerobaculia bacterium]
MTRLQIELPDAMAVELRRRAEGEGVTVSHLIVDLLQRDAGDVGKSWPEGFFERVAGAWQGEPLERPLQPRFEERDKL